MCSPLTPLPVTSRPDAVRAFTVRTQTGGVCYVLHNPTKARCEVRVASAGHALTLQLTANDTGFAEFAADGTLRAVESRDAAVLDGVELFRGEGRVMLMVPGGGKLNDPSAPRLVLFIGQGDVRLRCPQAPGREWKAEFGEFRDGRWTVLDTVTPGKDDGMLRLQATGPRRSGIALVAPVSQFSHVRGVVQALLH